MSDRESDPSLHRCDRQDVVEEDLRLLFANTGGTVKAFKFFQWVSGSSRVSAAAAAAL